MGAETSAAEPEPTPSLEDTLYAFEHEFGPGKPKRALWAKDINRIAEERRKTEDTEQVRSEHLADLVLSIRHWQERGETEHVRQLCETLVDRCMPEFQRRTYGLRHRPELREKAIAAMIEQLVLEARNPNEVFMTKNFAHYLRTLCAALFNQVLRQEGPSYGREISDSRDALAERMGILQEEQILLNLPDSLDRQIMVLRVLEGLQWEDIARICGKSERDLRRRFEKARTVLAAQLTSEPEQAPSGEELGAHAHDK